MDALSQSGGEADDADEEPGLWSSYGDRGELHKVGYFGEMMLTNAEINDAVRPLLNLSRGMIRRSSKLEYDLVSSLERDPLLKERLRRLRTVPGVGSITALTWALEIG